MLKKKIPWMILFLLMMAFSIWAVVSRSESFSPSLLRETLRNADVKWLVAAVLGMVCNILFEGLALDILVKTLTKKEGEKPIRSHGILYSAADIYFSAITPSASAGQPASAYFMSRDGIPVAESAVILVLNMLFYIGALAIVGVLGFAIAPSIYYGLDTLAQTLVMIGFIILLGLCLVFVLILKKEQWIKKVAVKLVHLGKKLHLIRDVDGRIQKIESAIEQYKNCADLIFKNKPAMVVAFLLNLLQRLSLVSTTVLVYLAFGGSMANLPEVTAVSCLVLVGVYSLPVPGGMGVADFLLLSGLCQIEDIASTANLALFSRGISFYSCIALTIVILIVGYLCQNRKIKAQKN
ncbi:MAG: flippase-like domain-containing protein [Clostridiales bacterium]|nr:flippase-like domain-containing protein [Clostridiales bacterium]